MKEKTKCRYADKYKAIRKPRCKVNGKVCDVCREKWEKALQDEQS